MTPRERFVAAASGKAVDRPPVWLMRQAGRYLPEYRTVKGATTFEERVSHPDVAAELTLQPMRRFPLDAAVIFSDILVPLAGMGRPAIIGPEGPIIASPVRTPEDVWSLTMASTFEDSPFVVEAIQKVRQALPDHAVVGFAGAPFTLAAYLIEGRATRSFEETKKFCYHHPQAWDVLLRLCAGTAGAHLRAQVEAGCDAVQLFDTWAEALAPDEYVRLALPHAQRALRAVRGKGAPTIYYARGTSHLLPAITGTGASVLSVDWRVPLARVREFHPGLPIQGNLDPTTLLASPEFVEERTTAMLHAVGPDGYIANLGHGILPSTPVESVGAFVRTVTQWSN